MIFLQTIKSLTEEENMMLLFTINNFFPIGQIIDNDVIKSYKLPLLQQQLPLVKGKIKEEYLPIFSGLCEKLEIKL